MNHGNCINCWWFKAIKNRSHIYTDDGLKVMLGYGKCYMLTSDVGNYSVVNDNSYCPDYYNRRRGNKEQNITLDEWLNNYDNE